jgi:hypothetical protein
LLVEDLQADHAVVDATLDGIWRPSFRASSHAVELALAVYSGCMRKKV